MQTIEITTQERNTILYGIFKRLSEDDELIRTNKAKLSGEATVGEKIDCTFLIESVEAHKKMFIGLMDKIIK
jgi:hypothetical protein